MLGCNGVGKGKNLLTRRHDDVSKATAAIWRAATEDSVFPHTVISREAIYYTRGGPGNFFRDDVTVYTLGETVKHIDVTVATHATKPENTILPTDWPTASAAAEAGKQQMMLAADAFDRLGRAEWGNAKAAVARIDKVDIEVEYEDMLGDRHGEDKEERPRNELRKSFNAL